MAERILVDFPFMPSARFFPSLESLLDFCTKAFLGAVSFDPNQDLTKFRKIFARVLNAYRDPPLEALWFFSALIFRDAPDDLRSILQLISHFTAFSRATAKPIALLAPVVSELFYSTKPRRKIEALVDAVLGCISTFCSRHSGGEVNGDAAKLLPVFGELVNMWTVRDLRGSCPFQVLFPLVREEARQDLMMEGCRVTFLAGVVAAEAYLLKLCLKVQDVEGLSSRSERQKELRMWLCSSISVFKNQQFFGDLLNILVNPPPLADYSLLSADDEILVRDVLYDALISSDYSVLSGAEVDEADSSLFPFFLSSLVATVDAISDFRCKRDEGRAVSYINAFSSSNIPRYLTSWAIRQAGTVGKPIAVTPEAFLKWLVDLEDKGLKVFGVNSSRIKERLMQDEGQDDNQSRISQSDADRFFTDKKSHQEGMETKGGEDEEDVEMETADTALMAAAHSYVMANGTRKRKDCGTEDATVVKFVKYKAEDSSVKDSLQATNCMTTVW